MAGFIVSNLNKFKNIDNNENNSNNDFIKYKNYSIQKSLINKFDNDKIFIENDEYILITDGVILNKNELCNESNLETYISTSIESGKSDFFNEFRGSFNGSYYIKNFDEWHFYTNHIGDKPIFYYFNDGYFICSSSFEYIIDQLLENEIKYTLDNLAVYDMLTYGFMVADKGSHTFVQEIKKLDAGTSLTISNKNLKINRYHMFDNEHTLKDSVSEKDIIEEIDKKFRNAVLLQFKKDEEYGYKHLVSLSGGLDSRMTTWVANDLGFSDITSLTFCQSEYLDETIAKEISDYLDTTLIFKSLNNAKYLMNIDDVVKKNFGLTLYSGIAHEYSSLDCLNFNKFGALHTGQVGDAILGTHLDSDKLTKPQCFDGAYSMKFKDKVENMNFDFYKNNELSFIYNRGFRAAGCSQLALTNFTEIISPFLDIDFCEYCLSIPLKLRLNHYIYKKWVIEKYPDAANFKWEKTNSKLTDTKVQLFMHKVFKIGIGNVFPYIVRKVIKDYPIKINKKNMNPFDYWLNNKKYLKNYMNEYFQLNINNSKFNDSIRNDLTNMYLQGSAVEKSQVLTVLSVVKIYFEDNKE